MATGSDSRAPIRLPFTIAPEQRGTSSSLDSKIVNAYIEMDKEGDAWVNKRPSLVGGAGSAVGRGGGIYRWKGVIFEVIGTNLYRAGILLGVVASGRYWFNQTLGTPAYLYLSNGTNGYTVTDAGAFAPIADALYITLVTVPGSAYLDGTLYVMDAQARIWGTLGLNNPTTWSALNLIQAQVEPDGGVALAKQSIYVIALKQWTTEVFYDAANPTGSPLLPVQNAKQPYGCVDGFSVTSIDDVLYWISANQTGGIRIVKMEKLQCKIISTPAIDRFLTQIYKGTVGEAHGWSARINGHSFYGVQFFSTFVGALRAPFISLIYDIEHNNWYFWSDPSGLGLPMVSAASSEGVYYNNSTIFQHWASAAQFSFIDDTFTGDTYDGGVTFAQVTTDAILPNWDGGVKLGKVFSRLKMLADSNSAGTLWVRWNDHDYKTTEWSNWLQVNLQDPWPHLDNLGTAKRRAFHFQHRSPTPFRMRAAELEVLLCPV